MTGAPNLAAVADGLGAARDDWRARHRNGADQGVEGFPSRRRIEGILADLKGALFPLRLGPDTVRPDNERAYVMETLGRALPQLGAEVRLELAYRDEAAAGDVNARAASIVAAFGNDLPNIRRLLDGDVEAAFAGDPAAGSVDEVLLCYPGVRAMIHHRIAHRLYRLGVPLVARIIAELAHSATGIDIHPGAAIGERFFIDHGTGVVIGETAVIGSHVRLYQAVTLGARSFPAQEDGSLVKGLPRHPIVEDHVVIYAGATVLGRVTIGAGAVIGGSVWLTESVPPGAVIHQAFAERETVGSAVPIGHVTEAARVVENRGETA
ncbi:serine acetyltransferase [Sphingomonas sanguinis]|uniref:serine O-acetyltransferase EpsC n=1 Tax=Sphingomonas sp. LC-1 TaxID=3110957 RepID=UPI0021BA80A3|nr:serine O-acetyltransferase EpsC [Sphingomonas sp. LC-1]MCT8003822.1 serine acetyltransferase [Sphingomonas sp. LC-1]